MPCRVRQILVASVFIMLTNPIFVDYAIANNLTPFISMQNHYNLAYREEEREMFPTLKVCLLRLFFGCQSE